MSLPGSSRLRLCLSLFVFGSLSTLLDAQDSSARLLQDFRWRNIGPGNFSGRIVDIEGLDNDHRQVLAASASGGVWKSTNAGTTWTPIFDRYGTSSIGDIAVFQPEPQIVWVGTGEANNRNSVSWGDGIYKSVDEGKNFVHMGLRDTYQIARVVTHPSNPEMVYVAAVGNLWGYSGDRGLFKTSDGGKTWQKLQKGLPDDGKTGATDLVMDPSNPEVLYVAFYQRLRRPYRFDSGGPNGGIFKSSDGGRSWEKLSRGLPPGDTGRIGLAISQSNPRTLMAIVEHGFQPTENDPAYRDLSKPGTGIYRSEDGGASWSFVNRYNDRPFYYSQIRINPLDDQLVYVLTRPFLFSDDGGRTLREGGSGFAPNFDYHAMWMDPKDRDRFYVGADKGMWLTQDHGDSMIFFENLPVGQYYSIGVDMRQPYTIYGGTQDNGSWGVPSFTRDARGILTDSAWKLHWGDGMFAQVDREDWRKVYTEAENGSLRLYDALTYRVESRRPAPRNVSNYGDIVPEVPESDRNELPDELFRFNWRSPLFMSPHNSSVLLLGANHLFLTADGGVTWRIISPDLSTSDPEKTRRDSGGLTRDNTGAETHCTITALTESPLVPGLIWAGTDDGRLHLTRDYGATWEELTARVPVPPGLWYSHLEASHHSAGLAYATIDGHRSDNRTTWVFRTEDFGKSWSKITHGLPEQHPAQVIREDSRNPSLLFLGTEFSLHASLDGGQSWTPLMNNLPTVPVYDLVIHPRERDLIAATHGRGLWILDDITPLEQLPAARQHEAFLFEPRQQILWEDQSRGGQMGHFYYAGDNPPTVTASGDLPARAQVRNHAAVHYHLAEEMPDGIQLEFVSLASGKKHVATLGGERGLFRYLWNLEFDQDQQDQGRRRRPEMAGVGAYQVHLIIDGQVHQSRLLTLKEDPLTVDR